MSSAAAARAGSALLRFASGRSLLLVVAFVTGVALRLWQIASASAGLAVARHAMLQCR